MIGKKLIANLLIGGALLPWQVAMATDPPLFTNPYAQVPPCTEELMANTKHQTGPSVVYGSSGQAILFARDSVGTLQYKQQIVDSRSGKVLGWNGSWQNAFNGGQSALPNQIPIGGTMNSDPVAIARGRINVPAPSWYGARSLTLTAGPADIFYVGNDTAIWHIRQSSDGSWNAPIRVDGRNGGQPVAIPAAGQVTVAYNAITDQAQLFYMGTGGSIMTYTQPPGNGTWSRDPFILKPAGTASNNPAVQDAPNGRRYVAYATPDNQIGVFWMDPGGMSARSIPQIMGAPHNGTVTSNVRLVLDHDGALDILYRYKDLSLWEIPGVSGGNCSGNRWCGAWGMPTDLGNRYTSDLAIRYLVGGAIEAFSRARDAGIVAVAQNTAPDAPQGYQGWNQHEHLLGQTQRVQNSSGVTLLSQSLFSIPTLITGIDGLEELFYVGANGNISYISELLPSTPGNPHPLMQNPATPKDLYNAVPAWSQPVDMGGNGIFTECSGAVPATFGLSP